MCLVADESAVGSALFVDNAKCDALVALNARLVRMEVLTAIFGTLILLLLFAVFYTRWWAVRNDETVPNRRRTSVTTPIDGEDAVCEAPKTPRRTRCSTSRRAIRCVGDIDVKRR